MYRVLDSPKHSAALSRELADLERLAEPHWRLESLAAPLAPKKMCVGARALRARSAALSKVIVRTEQNNFAGGGAVAGLVLRAPVEQMLWAPKTHHDILYRMLRTRQKAAPRRSPESWGAQNVPRNRAGKCRNAAGGRTVCAAAGARWEEERLLQAPCVVESGASEHFVTIKGVRAGSSRENLRFSSWMSDQYILISFPLLPLSHQSHSSAEELESLQQARTRP